MVPFPVTIVLLCEGAKTIQKRSVWTQIFWKRDAGEITYRDIFENEDFASVLGLRLHNAIVIIPFYSNQSNVLLVDAYLLENGEKTLCFQKYPDTCGHRVSERIYVVVIFMLHSRKQRRFWATHVNWSELFALFNRDFEQILGQNLSLRVKTLSNTNLVAQRYIKREKRSLPVDVRRSKT